MKQKTVFFLIFFIVGMNALSQSSDFPRIMYVNSTGGLRKRAEPSTDSMRIGIYLHGERITVIERTKETVTIDGITDYWYATNDSEYFDGRSYYRVWVFGGYLSHNLPLDVPVILGLWDDKDNRRQYYNFRANHRYGEGYKETDMGVWGTWRLNGNTLTLTLDSAMNEIIIDPPDIGNVQLNIIDRDNIDLMWSSGKVTRLRRNNNIW